MRKLTYDNIIVFIAVLQNPESQNVLVGSNATVSCRSRLICNIRWEELPPGANEVTLLSQDEGNGVYIREIRTSVEQEYYNSTLTIVITCSNAKRWNGTILQCSAGSGRVPSDNATLAIHCKSFNKINNDTVTHPHI